MKHEGVLIRRIIRANRLLAEQGHTGDTIAALAELAALRKDAERYRWIRNSDWDCFDSRWLSAHDAYGQGPDELDALVDAKMLEAPGIGAA